MTYKPIPTKADGIHKSVVVEDDDVIALLKELRDDIRVIHKYLALITNDEITIEQSRSL